MPRDKTRRRKEKVRASERSEKAQDNSDDLLKKIVTRIRKGRDADAVGYLSETRLLSKVTDHISTQCLTLDMAMHLPGIPCGRITTVYGAESSGKTTIVTHLIAEVQRRGGIGIYIDAEYAFDEEHAIALGVDPDKLLISQPDHLEDGINMVMEYINAVVEAREETGNDKLVLIVFDSVAGIGTKAEVEGTVDESQTAAGHAKIMRKACRMITKRIAQHKIAFVIVNQESDKVNFFGPPGADTTTMIAARPIRFHSSVILNTRQIETLKDSNKRPYAIRTRVTVKKNKLAPPFSTAEVVIRFEKDGEFPAGIDNFASKLALATEYGIITKNKGWYQYGSQKFHMADFPDVLRENPEIDEKLRKLITSGGTVRDEDDDDDYDEEDGD